MEKKLWAIYHGVDEDGGFGDAVYTEDMVGIVEATEEEITEFLEKYDNPIVYDKPYAELYCHHIRAEEVTVGTLDTIHPYGKDDYYGGRAVVYEIEKAFDEEHGEEWRFSDNYFYLQAELNSRIDEAVKARKKEHTAQETQQ